ncbi:MAG: hypothetical protein ABI876_01675 [Bacteroidota bacterium]
MSDQSIERMMRESYPPNLPYGFAERVASAAMTEGRSSLWELFLGMTPRVGLAVGALATVLMIFGFVGEGPNLIDAMSQSNEASIISLP